MGTEITLEVGGLTVDWSKNSRGNDHGALFQESDRKRLRSDQIDYDYFAENDEDPGPMEMAFSRSLAEVVPRLELLGFTLDYVMHEYADRVRTWREERSAIADDDDPSIPEVMTFHEFCAFATQHAVVSLDDTFISSLDDKGSSRMRGRFADTGVSDRLPILVYDNDLAYSEKSYFGTLVNVLHPYSVLRVLAQNALNLEANVVWQYGPLVEAGWAGEGEFVSGARRTQTFLVATEGTSDVHILNHAFTLLRPGIADFFRFIDVSERHPFSGAGNLLKFAEGLAKIDVHNQVIFLFDNDAEGYETYQKLLNMKFPPNMLAMVLPELDQFRAFPARGPNGVSNTDINRRAAGIECYLDLTTAAYPPAQVIWTNYKKELDSYQGSLEFKESYLKNFLEQTAITIAEGDFDVSKLNAVLDSLVGECSSMAASALRSPWL